MFKTYLTYIVTLVTLIGLGAIGGYLAHAEQVKWQETPESALIAQLAPVASQPSPGDRVAERQIEVYADRVILDIQHAEWARFTDTKSMEPVLHAGANAIEFRPARETELNVGDICSYRSEYADGSIIHRIVRKETDAQGTYFVFKGDNLPASDPGKIRFHQIERCVLAVIY